MAFEKWQFTRIVSTGAEPPKLPFMVDHLDGEPVYYVSQDKALDLWREIAGSERHFMREWFDESPQDKRGMVHSVAEGFYDDIQTHEDFILERLRSIERDTSMGAR